MRTAVLSDIHGNLPALEAVVGDLGPADDVVVCGDVVTGPYSAEVLDLVVSIPRVRFVRGNVERLVLEGSDEYGREWHEERERLGEARVETVAAWPRTLEAELEGLGKVVFCHSTPSSEDPIYTRLTPEDELLAVLGPVAADVLVCGHTHMQYDRRLSSGLRIVNPGSVGLPYEGRHGACWAVLDGVEVEFRRSEYDVEAAIEGMRALGAPVEERHYDLLLEPPDAEAATAEFEKLRGA